jgi:hypothetical protein
LGGVEPNPSKETVYRIDRAVRDASQNRMKLEASPRPVPPEKSEEVLHTIIEGAYHGTIEKIVHL